MLNQQPLISIRGVRDPIDDGGEMFAGAQVEVLEVDEVNSNQQGPEESDRSTQFIRLLTSS